LCIRTNFTLYLYLFICILFNDTSANADARGLYLLKNVRLISLFFNFPKKKHVYWYSNHCIPKVESFNAPADVRLLTGLPVYAYQSLPSEKATGTISLKYFSMTCSDISVSKIIFMIFSIKLLLKTLH